MIVTESVLKVESSFAVDYGPHRNPYFPFFLEYLSTPNDEYITRDCVRDRYLYSDIFRLALVG